MQRLLNMLVGICLLIVAGLQADSFFPDKPAAWVNDYANVLSENQEQYLNIRLRNLETATSNQIFIAIFDRIPEGTYLEEMAVKMMETWRPGLADKDNGLLLLVFIADRELRIEVGYGLEDVIPDAAANQVIDRQIVPFFRQQDYYGGLNAALDELIPAAEGKYQIPLKRKEDDGGGLQIPSFLVALALFLIFGRIFRGPRSRGFGTRPRHYWGPVFFGGFGGGSSRGGGFSGGGFSGGFGGISGGGGASGSW